MSPRGKRGAAPAVASSAPPTRYEVRFEGGPIVALPEGTGVEDAMAELRREALARGARATLYRRCDGAELAHCTPRGAPRAVPAELTPRERDERGRVAKRQWIRRRGRAARER